MPQEYHVKKYSLRNFVIINDTTRWTLLHVYFTLAYNAVNKNEIDFIIEIKTLVFFEFQLLIV